MISNARRRFLSAAGGGLAAAILPQARASLRSARILVGFPAGGTADLMARLLAERLQRQYASEVIVVNKPGAKFAPVMHELKLGPADGSVMYFGPDSIRSLIPHIYKDLAYDPVSDLRPVSAVAWHDYALTVSKAVPVDTLDEYLVWGKKNDAKGAQLGTLSVGSAPYLLLRNFARITKLNVTAVPYPGAAPGVNALLGGHVAGWFGPTPDAAARAGAVKILATTGADRSGFLPNVPTFSELGYPELMDVSAFGVFLRGNASDQTVSSLSNAIQAVTSQSDFQRALERLYYTPLFHGPADFSATIRRSSERARRAVEAVGFTAAE